MVIQAVKDYTCNSLVGITIEIFACSLKGFTVNTVKRNKLSGKSYGLLPEHKLYSVPFEECAVNLIGPWISQVSNEPHEFNACYRPWHIGGKHRLLNVAIC